MPVDRDSDPPLIIHLNYYLAQIPILFMSMLWGHQLLSLTPTKPPTTFSTRDPVPTPAGKYLLSRRIYENLSLLQLDRT